MSAAVEELYSVIDQRTLDLLEQRRTTLGRKDRGWLVRRALLAADVVGLTLSFAAAQYVYTQHVARTGSLGSLGELAAFTLSLPLWVVAAKLYGLYDRDEERTDHSTTDDFSGVFHLVTVCTFLLYALSRETGWVHPEFSKLLLFWLLAIASVPLLRAAVRTYCRRQITYLQNAIVVGAGDVGQTIARKLLKHPEYGVNLVGFVDSAPRPRRAGLEHIALLGGVEDVPELVELLDIDRVIVAFSNEPHDRQLELIRNLNLLGIQVDVVPRFFDVLHAATTLHAIEGLTVCSLPAPRLSSSSRFIKRCMDIIGAAAGLVLLAPLLALIAIAIKLDSPGPVVFRQVRMGERREAFRMWKFRSMSSDAEERKADLVHLSKHLGPGGDVRMFKIDDDPRVTRVGRALRRFSLDELPQLWNVLRGEMSLVGPRPLILEENVFVTDWAERRLDLRPGITGLWQVLGRDEIPFGEMVKLDYLYVTSWSLGNDLRLLFRTLPTLAGGRRVSP